MRALVVILGLALGILTGTSLLLVNPLSWLSGLAPLPADLAPAKTYRWDNYRGITGGAADLFGLARPDREVALMDRALAHVRIGIIVFPAGEGAPAALAVKVSAIADGNSLWRAQLGTNDYWNIFWPGEGSVFAHAYSNYWTVLRDTFFAGIFGGNPEMMAPSYAVTAPPPAGASAGVTGAAGRYAGFTGEIREILYPAPADQDRSDPDWAIAVKANPAPVTTR